MTSNCDILMNMENTVKKIIIIYVAFVSFAIFTLFASVVGFFIVSPIIKTKRVQNIVNKYDAETSISLENYLVNNFNSGVVQEEDGTLTFVYRLSTYSLDSTNKVSLKKSTNATKYSKIYYSMESMVASQSLEVGDIVFLTGYYDSTFNFAQYEIVEQKSGVGHEVELSNGLVARQIIYNKTISVHDLGAIGDGLQDDSEYIQKAIDLVDGEIIKFVEFENREYVCNDYISINQKNNLTIIGNNATLVVTNNFKNNDSGEFFFNIYQSTNVLISKLNKVK